MRKIEERMIDAVLKGKNWKENNTRVCVNALCGALKGCRPFSIRSGQLQSDPVHAVRLGDGAFYIYGVP